MQARWDRIAYFYNAIGTEVTVLEAMPQILPVEDSEVAEQLKRELGKQGIRITSVRALLAVKSRRSAKVRFTDPNGQPQEIIVDKSAFSSRRDRQSRIDRGRQVRGKIVVASFAVDEWYRLLDQNGKPSPAFTRSATASAVRFSPTKASAEGIFSPSKKSPASPNAGSVAST